MNALFFTLGPAKKNETRNTTKPRGDLEGGTTKAHSKRRRLVRGSIRALRVTSRILKCADNGDLYSNTALVEPKDEAKGGGQRAPAERQPSTSRAPAERQPSVSRASAERQPSASRAPISVRSHPRPRNTHSFGARIHNVQPHRRALFFEKIRQEGGGVT